MKFNKAHIKVLKFLFQQVIFFLCENFKLEKSYSNYFFSKPSLDSKPSLYYLFFECIFFIQFFLNHLGLKAYV